MTTNDTSSGGWLRSIEQEIRDPDYRPWRVGLSMCASWSMGVSMLAGLTLLGLWGLAPFLIWLTFNVLAVPIFAILYCKVDNFKHLINFRIMQLLMLSIILIQFSLNQQAMYEVLGPGVEFVGYGFMSATYAQPIVMAIAVLLAIFVYFYGLPGSITTDIVQYALQIGAAAVIVTTGFIWGTPGVDIPTGVDTSMWLIPATLGIASGPYVDATQWQRIEKAPQIETGLWAGVFFGVYMLLVLAAGHVFGPGNLLHGGLLLVVVFSVATSTLDSFCAALQRIVPYPKVALLLSFVGIGFWPFFYELGFGTLWSLMATARGWVVLGLLALVFVLEVTPGLSIQMLKTRWDESEPLVRYDAEDGVVGQRIREQTDPTDVDAEKAD